MKAPHRLGLIIFTGAVSLRQKTIKIYIDPERLCGIRKVFSKV